MPGVIGFDEAGRYSELVARLFGEVGIVPPGITLELDRPEWSLFKREQWFANFRTVAAGGAGNVSRIGLNNPAGSGRIAIVNGISCANGGGAAFGFAIRNGPTVPITANIQQVGSTDLRSTTFTGLTTTTDNNQASFAAVNTIDSFFVPLGNTLFWRQAPLIVPPGLTLFCDPAGVLNVGITAAFFGYVRPVRPEELRE